eukprot:scaffold27073_cov62-Phaeocystis_antarctica.AAC.2
MSSSSPSDVVSMPKCSHGVCDGAGCSRGPTRSALTTHRGSVSFCLRSVCSSSLVEECAGCAHGVRRVCAWCAHGVRMVCAWYTHGVRMGCTWCAHGLCAACSGHLVPSADTLASRGLSFTGPSGTATCIATDLRARLGLGPLICSSGTGVRSAAALAASASGVAARSSQRAAASSSASTSPSGSSSASAAAAASTRSAACSARAAWDSHTSVAASTASVAPTIHTASSAADAAALEARDAASVAAAAAAVAVATCSCASSTARLSNASASAKLVTNGGGATSLDDGGRTPESAGALRAGVCGDEGAAELSSEVVARLAVGGEAGSVPPLLVQRAGMTRACGYVGSWARSI